MEGYMEKRFSFKVFLEDEGLGKSKAKSNIRVGWDGRQDEIDYHKDISATMRELSSKNFDRFEESRASIVILNEEIDNDKYMVAKSKVIHEDNKKLLKENEKVNKLLEKIAGDLVKYTNELRVKDEEIAALKIDHKQHIRNLRKK
jgi:hypothetical protein